MGLPAVGLQYGAGEAHHKEALMREGILYAITFYGRCAVKYGKDVGGSILVRKEGRRDWKGFRSNLQ